MTKNQSTMVTAAGSVLAVGLITLIIWYGTNQQARIQDGKKAKSKHQRGDDDFGLLEQLFQDAANSVKSFPLGQGDQLMLYGLYKQATQGDVQGKAPSKLNIVANAKFKAWGKFIGMSKGTAMIDYISVVKHFLTEPASSGRDIVDDNADIVYNDNDDDEEEDSAQLMGGMGLRPSTMLVAQEEEEIEVSINMDTMPLEDKLRKAALENDIELMKSCLRNQDCNLDNKDESGQTALHFAADRNSLDVISFLLEHGADPNAADMEGISILQAAVIAGHTPAAKLLLKAGANPEQPDMDGDTPVSCAEDDSTEDMKEVLAKFKTPTAPKATLAGLDGLL